jgi:S1-C subfamily serine protease
MPSKSEEKLGALWFVRGLIKTVALIAGAIITVVCLMAIIGTQTPNGWARLLVAVAVAVIVPALLADRALARISPDKMSGVTTDVMALVYMGFALAFVGLAHGPTAPILQREGHRLEASGRGWTAKLAYALAGGRRVGDAVAPKTDGKDSTNKTDGKTGSAGSGSVGSGSPGSGSAGSADDKTAKTEPRAGDGKERTPAQIFTEFAPAVVTIMVKNELRGEGGGTGFILDETGTIATNHHVIENADKIEVKLMDGTILDDVEILTTDETKDLALLKVTPKTALPTVMLGDSDKVTVGERAVSIGNPLGLDHTLTDGLVSARRVVENRKMIQMSVPVSPGNSGGPLFNMKGEVIGVSTAIYMGGSPLAQNLNLAMPVNDVKALIKPDYPGRRKAGSRGRTSERW